MNHHIELDFNPGILLFAVAIILIGIAVYCYTFVVFGFNMTDELIEEERIFEICMELNIKSDECNMIYGNTNNSVDDGRID